MLAALSTGLLAACGTAPARHSSSVQQQQQSLPEPTARLVITEWQARLEDRLARADGDMAALAQLPGLRSPTTARPAQIVFSVTDVDALVPERDGYDAIGLLLGKHVAADATWYVFVVGTVVRRDYRPLAVVDVRLTALKMGTGVVSWNTGAANAEQLRRYRRADIGSAGYPFPADSDRFRMRACAPSACVEEEQSGARWTLYFPGPDAPSAASPSAVQ